MRTDADIRLTALRVEPTIVVRGDAATITITLESVGDLDAIIDYRVHHVGANGMRQPKVFKLTRRRLAEGEPLTIHRRHNFRDVSVRRIHPGRHTIDIQVNGRILGSADVDVVPREDQPPP